MIEKKLIEAEVEVKKIEKRVIEVYHYDGKEYRTAHGLKLAIGEKMSETFSSLLLFATNSCSLVCDTKVDILKRNLNSWGPWGSEGGKKLFESNRFDELIDQLKELKSVYCQISD